jgi:nitroreductase
LDAIEAIMSRHGVLRYRSKPVEPEKIELVLQAAIAAPSPANTQPWEFVVITEPALAREVAEYLTRTQEEQVFRRLLGTPEPFISHLMRLYEEFTHVSCFITVCRHQRVDLARPEFAATVRDWDLCSLGAAMGNLMAVATSLGLGTRWFGNPMLDSAPLRQMLDIPQSVEIVAVTPLGYHDEETKERPIQQLVSHTDFRRGDKARLAALLKGRLALEDVVHYNQYGSR